MSGASSSNEADAVRHSTIGSSRAVQPVLLLGATGGMGRRVAALWRTDVAGVPLRLGVRRREALAECAEAGGGGELAVLARLDEPESLRAAMQGVAVVINAIGPYAYDPTPLLEACAAAGAHYVDLASEPEWLAAVQRWAERSEVGSQRSEVRGQGEGEVGPLTPALSAAAGEREKDRRVGIAVCPGASTVPGLIELSAGHLAEVIGAAPGAFDVFLSMGSANRLTPGLLASLTLQLGVPLRSPEGSGEDTGTSASWRAGGASYRELRRRRMYGLGERLFGRYPSPFDVHGIRLGDEREGGRVPTRFWVGLDRAWIVHTLRGVSYLRPRFADRTWIALVERVRPLVGLANAIGGTAGGLRIEALDAAGTVLGAVNVKAEREGLNIPALPAVWAARALATGSEPGYRPLRSLVTFDAAAASLRGHGYEVVVEPGSSPLTNAPQYQPRP